MSVQAIVGGDAADETFAETRAALLGGAGAAREAAALGRALAPSIDRVYFVACGAPNRTMLMLEYWIGRLSPSLEVRRFFPAEFLSQDPARFDARTLVVMGSKSGTTRETVETAEFLAGTDAVTVGFTTTADRPLARAVRHPILTGEAERDIVGLPHASLGLAMLGLLGGLLAARDGWPHGEALLSSIEAFPAVAGRIKAEHAGRAARDARALAGDSVIYHLASGPMFCTAYVFGVCTLMEMQRLNSTPLEAAEFFHGPFEVLDEDVPVFLLLGEDPSRPIMERAKAFCERYGRRLFIYDSRDLEMEGVDAAARALLAPYAIGVALDCVGEEIARLRDHPLETRRYMGVVDY